MGSLRDLVARATPWPWAVGYWMKNYGTYGGKWVYDPHIISGERGKAAVCGNYDWEEGGVVRQEDARLIALAPELAVWAADARDALDMCHTGMGNIVCSRGGIGCSVYHDRLEPLIARLDRIEQEGAA